MIENIISNHPTIHNMKMSIAIITVATFAKLLITKIMLPVIQPETFSLPNEPSQLTYTTKNIIYLNTCSKCDLQYIEETGQTLKKRISQHRYHLGKKHLE